MKEQFITKIQKNKLNSFDELLRKSLKLNEEIDNMWNKPSKNKLDFTKEICKAQKDLNKIILKLKDI